MSRINKKVAGGVVVAVACACALAFYGTSGGGGSSGGGTVSVFASQPQTPTNLSTNWFTQYVHKNFGLNFDFQLVPDADASNKLSLVLASGKYPDEIWSGFSYSDALTYGEEGVFIPLNDLIKKYAPNVWHAIQTVPGMKQEVTAPNGKIYALTNYDNCYKGCYWWYNDYINVNDLNKYHLSMPKTTGQFQHVLEVFKQHGLVPLTGGSVNGYGNYPVTFLMNAFIPDNGPGAADNHLVVQNGKLVFGPAQPQWRAGLAYIHRLYAEGLFSTQALSQDGTAIQQLMSQNKVGVVPDGAIQSIVPNYGSKGSGYLDWVGIPALRGPAGAQYSQFGGLYGGLSFAITKNATQTQQIQTMKLLNYLYTPQGMQVENFGPEGKLWAKPAQGTDGFAPEPALYNSNYVAVSSSENWSWWQFGPSYAGQVWRVGQEADGPYVPTGGQSRMMVDDQVDMAGHQPEWIYPTWGGVWIPNAKAQQYSLESTNLENYVEQWTAEFITGRASISQQWNSYIAGLKKLGMDDFVNISQQAMGKPFYAGAQDFQPDPADIKYLLSKGPVPPLIEKYLIQSGVPASDFTK